MTGARVTCPSPEALAAWIDGSVADATRAELVLHTEGCESCRETVGMLERMRSSGDVVAARARSERPSPPEPEGRALASIDVKSDAGELLVPGPGERVGRFLIRKVLGKGGMGVVLLARDERLDRDVALKIARGERAASARLREEGRSLAALRHPNLVAVHEVGEEGGRPYLVMELVRGLNLRADVTLHRPEWRATLARCLEAAQGVEALHDAGFVHRDLKPDNLMLADDGRVVVVDLGLARRAQGERPPESARTKTGAIVGTPRYLAPERVAGAPADVASDVYALAATTLELVRASRGTPPPRLVAALTRALDPDPSERPASVAALRAQLVESVSPRWGRWVAGAAIACGAIALGVATRERAPTEAGSGDADLSGSELTSSSALAPSAAPTIASTTAPSVEGVAPDSSSARAPSSAEARAPAVASSVAAPAVAPASPASGLPSGVIISGPAASAALASALAGGSITIDPRPLPPVFSREWMARMSWPPRTFELGYAKIVDGYAPCANKPEPVALPSQLDWGTIEKYGVVELTKKDGKTRPELLVMMKGRRGRQAFVGVRDGSYLDAKVGDWVLVRQGHPLRDESLPPEWDAVKEVHFSQFAPIAGPPAWSKRAPAPQFLPCGPRLASSSKDMLDFDAERVWLHGEASFLFTVSEAPATPLADGVAFVDGFLAEAPASLPNLELLHQATRKRPIWVIGRFLRIESYRETKQAVMKLEEILPRLVEPPAEQPARSSPGAANAP